MTERVVDAETGEITQVGALPQGDISGQAITNRSRIPGGRGGELTPFDSASASAAARKRWDDFEARNRAVIAEAGGTDPIITVMHDLAMSGGPGSTQAASLLFKAAGYTRPARSHDEQAGGGQAGNSDIDDLLYAHRQRVASDPAYAARVAELRQARLADGGA